MRLAQLPAIVVLAGFAAAETAPPLQPFLADSKVFAIHKPADWRVTEVPGPHSFRILVASPDGAARVDFYWAEASPGRSGALWLIRTVKEILATSSPDVVFSEVFLSRDGTRGLANLQLTAGNTRVRGRYFFEAKPSGYAAQGYWAPQERLASIRPTLLNVMASLAFSKAQTLQPPVVQFALHPRQAPDGSLSLSVPADWGFLAGGGRVITSAPDGSMGFVFTSFQGNPMLRGASIAQGVLGIPYQPPVQTLGAILQAFGHRNYRVLSNQTDAASNQEFMALIRRRCDTQDVMATWTSSKGSRCVGSFKMLNALPSITGMWFTIMAGVWGPEDNFHRYYPALETIGSSFTVNDRYAQRYIHAGLENLRRLQQHTADAVQDLNRSREQNQRDWEARQSRKDYMESRWDDYRRGNSYWISDVEGGKVYHTDSGGTRDTLTGDYYEGRGYNWVNFEGENPRYRENMREVSSYELEQMRR